MPSQWYYAHDEKKLGPFSQDQLKEMAAAGVILPTDTVWMEGVAQGAQASRIKNLFARAGTPSAPVASSNPVAAPELLVVKAVLVPIEKADDAPKSPAKAAERPAKKGRAVALKGCDIASQDGAYCRYRKKCTVCGTKDSACRTIPIANRLYKDNYFCPKCRKRRDVAIQCQLA